MSWIREKKLFVAGGAALGAVVVAFLAFGVFGVHTAFIDDEVSEAGPVFDSGASLNPGSPVVDGSDDTTPAPATTSVAGSPGADDSGSATTEPSSTEPPAPASTEVASPPTIVTVATGQFVDRSYTGSGTALVLTDGSSQRFLRFEDFATDNGPDLFVYLTTARADADEAAFGAEGEYVNLGRLNGNIGDQNYEIPPEVDLDRFSTVVIWCDRFSSAFTAADLA